MEAIQKHCVVCILINLLQALLLEKAMAPYSRALAWKIPRTEEPAHARKAREITDSTSDQIRSVAQSCPTLGDPMKRIRHETIA